MLHDELKLIYQPPVEDNKDAVVDEWQEVGQKNAKCHINEETQKI
jgi:ubiquitin C-terminal hydrolase